MKGTVGSTGTRIFALMFLAGGLALAPFGRAVATPPDPRPGASMPVRELNLDMDGLIRVHEQGVADVNVTNDSLDVTGTVEVMGTVDVGNFPTELDVNVTGGSVGVSVPAATEAFTQVFVIAPDDQNTTNFPTINATTIHASTTANDEVFITFLSPLGALFQVVDLDGDAIPPAFTQSFFQPVPINGVEIRCHNESSDCGVRITVVGS